MFAHACWRWAVDRLENPAGDRMKWLLFPPANETAVPGWFSRTSCTEGTGTSRALHLEGSAHVLANCLQIAPSRRARSRLASELNSSDSRRP